MANRWGNSGNSGWLYVLGLKNHRRLRLQPSNKKILTPWKEICNQLRQHFKKQRHYFANKGWSSQGYGFSSGYVWVWELNCEESWALKNWCFWTVVLEKTLESPLDCKEIKPKISPEYALEGLMLQLELQYFGHLMAKNWLIGKDPDAGKDWRQEEKGTTKDEMAGWHHQRNGHEFE